MLPRRLVRDFGELADQFLEDEAHLVVVDRLRVQIDLREALGDLVEQPGLVKPIDLGVKLEALEDIAHGWRECLNVAEQVLADVILVAHQLLHVERRGVVEALAGLAQQERLRVQPGFLLVGKLLEDGFLRRFEHAVEATQNGEGQDNLAVVGLLVVATQEVSDGPEEC